MKEGGVGGFGEGLLELVEFLEFAFLEQVDLAFGLDVVASGVEVLADFLVAGLSGLYGDGYAVTVVTFGDVGFYIGFLDVFDAGEKVVGEFRVVAVFEVAPDFTDEVEGLMAVAEPPFAVFGFEFEAVADEEFADFVVEGVLFGGETDGEVAGGAVDVERVAEVVAVDFVVVFFLLFEQGFWVIGYR